MHVGELLRDQISTEEVRWAEAVEDYITLATLLGAVLHGAPGAWAERAACKGQTEVMFPTKGQSTAPAKRLCASCPVLEECSDWAATVPAGQGGVIAGQSERARRQPPVTALPDAVYCSACGSGYLTERSAAYCATTCGGVDPFAA